MENEIWNDDWREELKNNHTAIYERLCDCDNKKSDIEVIAVLMQKYNQNVCSSVVLDRVMEWLTVWNNQSYLELTLKEYNKIIKKMLTYKS